MINWLAKASFSTEVPRSLGYLINHDKLAKRRSISSAYLPPAQNNALIIMRSLFRLGGKYAPPIGAPLDEVRGGSTEAPGEPETRHPNGQEV